MKAIDHKKKKSDIEAQKPPLESWDDVFKQTQQDFEAKYVSKDEHEIVNQIKEILFALDEGPGRYGARAYRKVDNSVAEFKTGFTEWDGNMLARAQFKLSRLLESLGRYKKIWQNRADHVYIYHKISFAQDFTKIKKQAQELIDAGERKHRITDTEVESEITPKLFKLEEFKIMSSGRYMELDALQKSVEHVIISIRQEIRDRESDKRLPQNQY